MKNICKVLVTGANGNIGRSNWSTELSLIVLMIPLVSMEM